MAIVFSSLTYFIISLPVSNFNKKHIYIYVCVCVCVCVCGELCYLSILETDT